MNGPDPQHDPFSARPPSQEPDLSAYEDPLPDIGSSDAETIAKINRRTSPFGRIVGVLIVAGAVGLGYWAYQQNVSFDSRNAVLEEAGKLEGPAMLAYLRDNYPKVTHEDVKERVLLNLGAFKDVQSVPLMVQALDEA